MGITLFVHSVRLVLNDWRNALRISGLLYLVYAIPNLLFRLLYPAPPPAAVDNLTEAEAMAAASQALATAPIAIVSSILGIVAFVWIAVAWHRYVLLDELPERQLPPFDGARLFRYFLYSLGIFVLAFIVAVVVGAVAGLVFAIIPPLLFLAALLALAAGLVVGYRLAPLLPATAVGQPLTFSAAWEATKGATGAIVVLAIVSAIASFVIDLPAVILGLGGQVGTFLALLWLMATEWVKMLVGVSILTTLYGHYVEGRAIPSAG